MTPVRSTSLRGPALYIRESTSANRRVSGRSLQNAFNVAHLTQNFIHISEHCEILYICVCFLKWTLTEVCPKMYLGSWPHKCQSVVNFDLYKDYYVRQQATMLYKLAFNPKCIAKHLEEMCSLHSNFLRSLYHMPMTEEWLPCGDFIL
jgi:hypothetical protein